MNKQLKNLLLLICIFSMHALVAQITTITGTITNASDGMPIPGVNVIEKDTSNGVITDFDGNYTLEVSNGNAILQFSFLGYEDKEVAVNGQTVINTTLEEGSEVIDEVVITALGLKRKTRALGYSVSEVSGDAVSTVKTTNAINSLQGKIAGVNITQNATGAAGSSRVVIRGSSSLSGNNQPLYIVDGIPIGNDNNGSAGLWGGSDGGDGVSSLNPDDIESVSVLKGGAAGALYGSNSSGGVVIITTKSGKNQKGFGVDYTSTVSFDKVDTSLQDYQTEYGQGILARKPANQEEARDNGLSSWGAKLDGSNVVQWDGVSRPYSSVGSNLDNFYKTGITFINSLALSSGSEKGNFRFSVSDLTNQDVIPNTGLNRKTYSLNSSVILANKLTATVNVKYIIEKVNNRPRLSDAPGNGNFTVANLPANVDVRFMNPGANEDGTERTYTTNTYSQNPYFAAFNFRNEDVKNRIIASTTLVYNIFDWLDLTGRVGIDNYTIRRTAVQPFGTAYKPLGGINDEERRFNLVDSDLILNAKKDLTDKFSIDALIGVNRNSIQRENLFLGGDDFIVPGLEDIGNTVSQSRSRDFGEQKKGGVYGQLEVSYDRWAYLTFTGRNDTFSTLSFSNKTTPNNYFYPSISASVVLSDAIELPEFINFLKIRGGYAEIAGGGNDPYQLALTYEIFGNAFQGQPLGRIFGNTVPNGNLIPYNVADTEIGFDARLFDRKLRLDFAYYKRSTTNDIVKVKTSVFSGSNDAIANIGKVDNKGVEFLMEVTPIQNDNFSWTTSLNGGYNKSEIIATNAVNGNITLDEPRSRNVNISHVVGEAYGTIFGVSYDRDANGNIRYEIDAQGVPRAVEGERKILGEGIPPLTLGFSNSFSYKNFRLNFLIDGKFGGQIFSGTNTVLTGNGLHKSTLEGRENGLSVTGIDAATGNEFTTIVAPENLSIYWGEISDIAEEFVEDSDYIKFRQLSLGYSFPERFLKNIFIKKLDISFIASNLFYIKRSVDNIDPESAYNVGNSQGLEYFGVPSTRSYGLNLNVKF
jgi:TonB-linked SusC/RagA family outer membrane protein